MLSFRSKFKLLLLTVIFASLGCKGQLTFTESLKCDSASDKESNCVAMASPTPSPSPSVVVATPTPMAISPSTFSLSSTANVVESIEAIIPVQKQRLVSTLLPNGKILITGGQDMLGNVLADVELFDPLTKTFSRLTDLQVPRHNHNAFLLASGKVLLIGGHGSTIANSKKVELYDPSNAGSSTFLSDLPHSHHDYEASVNLLSNGKVLLIGGYDSATIGINGSVTLYDPTGSGIATSLTTMPAGVAYGVSALLPNDKVLVCGGFNSGWAITKKVYLYDPAGAGTVTTLTDLSVARAFPGGGLRSDGMMLIMGGATNFSGGASAAVELYDPTGAGSTTLMTPLPSTRGAYPTMNPTVNDVIYLIGGGAATGESAPYFNSIFAYNAYSGATTTIPLPVTIGLGTTTVMQDGRFFITGGLNSGPVVTNPVSMFFSVFGIQQFTITHGEAPVSYSLASGNGTIDSAGLFVPSGTGSVVIKVTDADGKSVQALGSVQ